MSNAFYRAIPAGEARSDQTDQTILPSSGAVIDGDLGSGGLAQLRLKDSKFSFKQRAGGLAANLADPIALVKNHRWIAIRPGD